MGMFRHVFRTLTRPYYVAMGQTIGDFAHQLLPAVYDSGGDPERIGKPLKMFDAVLATFAGNSNRATLALAVEHLARRVASRVDASTAAVLFADDAWFRSSFEYLRNFHPEAGNGIAAFQQALKDSGLISVTALIESSELE